MYLLIKVDNILRIIAITGPAEGQEKKSFKKGQCNSKRSSIMCFELASKALTKQRGLLD